MIIIQKESAMKNKMLLMMVIVMLVSLVPMAAFAAAPAELTVKVKNNTGGVVTGKAEDSSGNLYWLDLPAGVSEITMTEGVYTTYLVTNCGTQYGTWNLNVTKVLEIECQNGSPDVSLYKQCPDNLYGHYWYAHVQEGLSNSWWFFFAAWDNDNIPDLNPGIPWQDGGIDCWSNRNDHWPKFPF